MKEKQNDKSQLTVDNWQLTAKLMLSIGYFLLSIVLNSCGHNESAHQHDTYTCPMHPTVISDKPGACPVCGMDLVRKASPGEEVQITEDLAKLIKSPNEIVVASIRTIKAEYQSMPVSLDAQGLVTYDTRLIQSIATRTSGRLEKLYLKYDYQPVAKGQKIAEIYSPELISAQRELIFLLKNDPENTAMIEAAKEKLKLSGVNKTQLEELEQTMEVRPTLSLFSNYSGYLVNNLQTPSSGKNQTATEPMNAGMDTTLPSGSTNGNSESIIREGNYVTAGQTLFTIVNTEAYRVEFDLPAASFAHIKKGDKLNIDFGNGSVEQTSVDFVQPFFTTNKEFVKVRVITKNTEGLHIGHFVHAHIHASHIESLWVPRESVLDLGDAKIVFVKNRNVFQAQKVATGNMSEGQIEIKSGLASADEIAQHAHYLVDSESFIKTKK
ncbi:MAG TPA: efflux RND transporter periplasmic adaptor subunit [Ohtaekwangia sp.]